jgi:hypothetical protein
MQKDRWNHAVLLSNCVFGRFGDLISGNIQVWVNLTRSSKCLTQKLTFSLKMSITNFANKIFVSIHPHTDTVGGRVSLFSDSHFAPKLQAQRP